MPPRLRPPAPLQHHMHKWRKHRRMTLEQLGDAIGGGKSHLSLVERGLRDMTPNLAVLISQALGITPSLLIGHPPDERPDDEAELLAIWRSATPDQQRAIIQTAKILVTLGRSVGEG